eukprot:5255564-Pleurochrysis_carterae.AAC.1
MAQMHDELKWSCFLFLPFRRALLKRRFASAHWASDMPLFSSHRHLAATHPPRSLAVPLLLA